MRAICFFDVVAHAEQIAQQANAPCGARREPTKPVLTSTKCQSFECRARTRGTRAHVGAGRSDVSRTGRQSARTRTPVAAAVRLESNRFAVLTSNKLFWPASGISSSASSTQVSSKQSWKRGHRRERGKFKPRSQLLAKIGLHGDAGHF